MIRRIRTPKSSEEEKIAGFDSFELKLGDLMRGERATLGKSLLDVQRELKVKATYIAAIENADPLAFDTPGFIAGYVRSYARYLGMDPEWAYATFCRESNFETAHGMSEQASSASTKAERKARKYEGIDPLANPNATFVPRGEAMLANVEPGAIGSVAVLIALIAGLGYGGYSVLQEIQRVQFAPVTEASGVGTALDPLRSGQTDFSEDVLPVEMASIGSDASSDALNRLYRPPALELPVLVARDGPISTIKPDIKGEDASVLLASVEAALLEIEENEIQVVEEAASELKIFAVRPAWVRVSAADGTVLFEKILDAGEEFIIPPTEEPPMLRAGNSGSVYFGVNGETFGPAGKAGSVVSKVALASDLLSETYTVADLTADQDLAQYVAMAAAEPEEEAVPPTD
ncbi:helix-turn-helix domain-containing protein [Falsihalocynthiibacter sp. SS001]|uniref:helix-turn-helix domain-containing protein n=1 Tax=Falsihalocynthiibacter sp. SS001 TaxID=3349698 RepID=UPI0036D2D734